MNPHNALRRSLLATCTLAILCLVVYFLSFEERDPDQGKTVNKAGQKIQSTILEDTQPEKKYSPGNAQTCYSELLNPGQTRLVEIHQASSQRYPIRKEQIISELPGGGSVVKRESSYIASHILIGLDGQVVPEELRQLGQVVPLYPESGLGHFLLTIEDWHMDSVQETLVLLSQEPYAGLL